MLVTCQQMSDAEERLFSTGVEAEPLMEKAGLGCADAISTFFPAPGRAVLFCGKGNNGGDALVAGRWLRKRGWKVEADLSHSVEDISSLAAKKMAEFSEVPDGKGGDQLVLVDGLLGIGARGPLRGKIGESARRMNDLRLESRAYTFAVDIPSGIDGDTGEPYEGAVVADFTLSICAPKKGIVADQAINHVGRIVEIPLPEIPVEETSDCRLIFPSNLRPRFQRRTFDTHKGMAGRVSILAGSRGTAGAAVLTALGASRAGAGLVSVFVPENIYQVVAAKCPAEVMVLPDFEYQYPRFVDSKADVYAMGPGLAPTFDNVIREFMETSESRIILDAEALNFLSGSPDMLEKFPAGKRLLTPHPGELRRLAGDSEKDRVTRTRDLAEKWNVSLLHKGARTVVATPGEKTEINTTGHPGMASGGMGDVLTGVCAALAGQGMSLHDAACAGSWVLGRAAELDVFGERKIAPNSVSAVQVAESIPLALREL